MASIKLYFQEKGSEDFYNKSPGTYDFRSFSDLKQFILSYFESITCPSCGGHRVHGGKIRVEYQKVLFYNEIEKKRFLRKPKHVDKLTHKLFRYLNIYLDPGGRIKCKSCKWQKRNVEKTISWVSVDDLGNSQFWKNYLNIK